ncbi:MAG: histidinol-phosphate transaminase [Candidatus Eutrophobiaceae bacterium]
MSISTALPHLLEMQPYQTGQSIVALARKHGIPEERIVNLAANENPLGCSPKASAALQEHLHAERYPEGNGDEVRTRLAEICGTAAERIALGNGSNEILELLARAFVPTDGEILYSEYSFAMYASIAQAIGARHHGIPAKDMAHDLDAIASAVGSNTYLVFLANPNNPTGSWFTAAALQAFMRKIPERVIVVLDEAYHEYACVDPQVPDWLAVCELQKEFPNLAATRTFSKAYGLAGLRIGYSIAHERITELLNRLRQPFNVNCAALCAAQAALEDQEHLRRSQELNLRTREQLAAGLDKLKLEYRLSPANFALIFLPRPGKDIAAELLADGVVVRPMGFYGLPNALRVSLGTEDENARFLAALAKSA